MLLIGSGVTIRGQNVVVGDANLPLINQGTIRASEPANNSVYLRGTQFTNEGTVEFLGGGSLRLESPNTNNAGRITSRGAGQVLVYGVIASQGDLIATNGGSLYVAGTLTSQGTVMASGGGTVRVDSVASFSGGTLTEGTWRVGPNSVLRLIGADIVTNAAAIVLDGDNSHLYSRATGTTNALTGFATNAPTGALSILGGRDFATAAAFTNEGSLTIGAGSTFTVAGDYNQAASGAANIELAGIAEFGRLVVNDVATLAGTLNLALAGGFEPSVGDTFQVLTYGSHNGEFDEITDPDPTLRFDPIYSDTGLTLEVVSAALRGDMNGDGAVNKADHPQFVLALLKRPAYEAKFPEIDVNTVGDINRDGMLSRADLRPFVQLFSGDRQATGEPSPPKIRVRDVALREIAETRAWGHGRTADSLWAELSAGRLAGRVTARSAPRTTARPEVIDFALTDLDSKEPSKSTREKNIKFQLLFEEF